MGVKEKEMEERLERERKEVDNRRSDERDRGKDRDGSSWRAKGGQDDDRGERSGGAWKAGGGGGWRERAKNKEDEWGPGEGGRGEIEKGGDSNERRGREEGA